MSVLVPLGLGAIALLGIAYLTWRFRTVARLRRALGRPFSLLAEACAVAADEWKRLYERTLAWSETLVIVRLVYLVAGLGIFLGDYSISRLRGGALMGIPVGPLSWLPLENVAGLLWLLVPALLGATAVELLGLIPAHWRLLPYIERMHVALRLVLAGVIGLLFLLSLVITASFILWGQLTVIQSTTMNADALSLYIVTGFGILLAFVSCIAFYAIIVGLGAVVSLLLGVSVVILHVLRLCLLLLGSVVANTTGATMHHEGEASAPEPPEVNRSRVVPTLPVEGDTESEETHSMASVNRNVTVQGYGSNSSRLVSMFLEHLQQVGASGLLQGSGVVDPTHTYRKETLPSISGGKDYTPSVQQVQLAYADEVVEPGMTKLAVMLHEQLVEALAQKQGGTLIVAVDLPEVEAVAPALEALKSRKPHLDIVALCPLSRVDRKNETALTRFAALQEQETLAGTFVLDAHASKQAALYGTASVEQAAMEALVGLCIAPYSDESNPTLRDVLMQLREASPLAGMAFAAAPTVAGRAPIPWKLVQAAAPHVGDRGSGDMADMIIQATNATKRLFADATLTASPAGRDLTAPCFVLYHLPYARGDNKRFAETATSLNHFLRAHYPNAQAIMVHGNGVALPGMAAKFRVGVSCFFPLSLPATQQKDVVVLEEMQVSSDAVGKSNGQGRRKHEVA